MTSLKLRVNGEEKGSYSEESIAFGKAFLECIHTIIKEKKEKQARVLNVPVEQFEAYFPQGEN